MRLLALEAALARCSAAVAVDAAVLAVREHAAERGEAALLPELARSVLAEAGLAPGDLDAVAVCVGPGSFTGLRASLAFAQGLAAATGREVIGVTVAEALAAALPDLGGRALWTAIDSRRPGRVFLAAGNAPFAAVALEALPAPERPVAIAGDAAVPVAARLAARGADVRLTDARRPHARGVAAAALRRAAGALPPLAAQPLYVDAPQVRLPEGGLRPPPISASGGGT